MKTNRLLPLLFICFPWLSFANNVIPITRFEKPLAILESVLNEADGTEDSFYKVANKMLYGPRRIAAFQLQALGQIYQKDTNELAVAFFKNTLRFSAKSLEDAIGGYDKWDEIIKDLKMKDAPASQIAKAEKNKDVSFHILVYVLTGKKHHSIKNSEKLEHEENEFLAQYETEKQQSLLGHLEWIGTSPTLLQGLRTQLHSWPWLAEEADREYVIKRLRKQLKDVNKTKFNFALLEDTENEKGLHEFRREVRWFSFQAGVLNGTVNFYDTFLQNNVPQCPNLELAKLTNPNIHPELTKSPYTKLPQSPFADERICGISRCLYYKISKIVSDVGEIKDRVEKGNFAKEAGNITPPSAVQDVQIIYNDMKTSGVIDHLRDQLKACY